MGNLAALAVHAGTFGAFVWFVPGPVVSTATWAILYLLGAVWIAGAGWAPRLRLSAAQALKLAVAALWLAALFFGADGALTALGNSVKPRQPPPGILGGLPIWFCLVPGVASTSLGLSLQGWLRGRADHTEQPLRGDASN